MARTRKSTISPPRTVEPTESTAKLSPLRVHCDRCDKLYAAGAVVNHEVQHDPEHDAMVMARALYCDHCDHVQTWLEAVSPNGRPSGYLFDGPHYLTARESVDRFLDEHPEARGVSQS